MRIAALRYARRPGAARRRRDKTRAADDRSILASRALADMRKGRRAGGQGAVS